MTIRRQGVRAKVRHGTVAALDVGSTKVCCFVGRAGEDGGIVTGIGHHLSEGVRGGVIIDMEAAEASIRAAVESAEQMAGETVSRVVVGIAAGQPTSRLVSFDVAINGHQIGESDLRRVLDPGWLAGETPSDRTLIHTIPVSFSIDGTRGVRDPRGMYGERLGVNLHAVTVAASTARNLVTCIERCHLEVEAVVIAPYASGLGCLAQDEKELGMTVIDMGGGTTTLGVFFEGELVHTDSVPVGGAHVSNDIARGLSTTVADAERIKTLFGHALPSPSDDREVIEIHHIGDDEGAEAVQVPRSMLVGIIKPRIEETFELVRTRLEASGFDRLTGRHIVLTGGASQLSGVPELAERILDKPVYVRRPTGVRGLAEAVQGPAFSLCAGLLRFALEPRAEWLMPRSAEPSEPPAGPWSALGRWFKANF